ncbi:hypothetical protein C8F01DRAFT_1247411 [Mycena amicta]|nr:hypothetical protein C8F01DRAFT_1247411 [Mycena amicta]
MVLSNATTAFNVLATTGLVLLTLTLLPAVASPQVQRSPLWFSMISSWMVYSVSYMLLLGHQGGPDPPRGICGLQMMAIYAAPPLTTTTGLAFLIDILLKINKTLFTDMLGHRYTLSLLIVPWAIYAAVAVEALVVGDRGPADGSFIVIKPQVVSDFDEIQRHHNNMYCHTTKQTQTRISAVICVVGLSIALTVEGWIITILYRNWALFRLRKSKMGAELRLASLVRILVFTLQTAIGLGMGAVMALPRSGISQSQSPAVWSALLPLLPVMCGITFSSQADIRSVYMFRKPHEERLNPLEAGTRDDLKGFEDEA